MLTARDRNRHIGVAGAADLGALAVIGARFVDLEPGVVGRPGTASTLMPKDGIGEGVQDVAGGHQDADLDRVDGQDQILVDREQPQAGPASDSSSGIMKGELGHRSRHDPGIFVAPVPLPYGRSP